MAKDRQARCGGGLVQQGWTGWAGLIPEEFETGLGGKSRLAGWRKRKAIEGGNRLFQEPSYTHACKHVSSRALGAILPHPTQPHLYAAMPPPPNTHLSGF